MDSDSIYYFGYGSNLLQERMKLSNKSAQFHSLGLLLNHELTFRGHSQRWKGGVATVLPKPGRLVIGCIYSMKKSDSQHLDAQEGYYPDDLARSWYIREELPVYLLDENLAKSPNLNFENFKNLDLSQAQQLTCRIYFIQKFRDDPQIPSPAYKQVFTEGGKQNRVPEFYQKFLENVPCNDSKLDDVSLLDVIYCKNKVDEKEIDRMNKHEQ